MSAVLFGSISTLADTSELQRSAFNQAFDSHGLAWHWDQEEYQQLLTGNGGADRIAAYAEQRGDDVDAAAVHATKSKIFQEALGAATPTARPGVVDTVTAARAAGWQVGLITTTSRANLAALLGGLDGLGEDDFDVITDVETVDESKPDPAAYLAALESLGETAAACVAVEDNLGGVAAAESAGVSVVAFPNENTAAHDFGGVDVVDLVAFDELSARAGAGR